MISTHASFAAQALIHLSPSPDQERERKRLAWKALEEMMMKLIIMAKKLKKKKREMKVDVCGSA